MVATNGTADVTSGPARHASWPGGVRRERRVYLLNDGVKEIVCCGQVDGGEAGDRMVLVGGRDPLDDIRNCPAPTTQRLAPTAS